MVIILTGATGFLGNVLAALLAQEHRVVCLGRSQPKIKGVEWRRVELSEPLPVSELPEKVDTVIHLAQAENYRAFPEEAESIFTLNVGGAIRLLDYARTAGASQFVFASSGSIYEPFTGELRETDHLSPTEFYAATKLAAESLAAPYRAFFKICVLRLFFLYGPGQTGKLVANLIDRIQANDEIPIAGEDGAVVTPTFSHDAAAVFAEVAREQWDGTYNVAGPEALSLRQITDAIGERLVREPRLSLDRSATPEVIRPCLDRLKARYDVSMFRRFGDGLDEIFDAEEIPRQ